MDLRKLQYVTRLIAVGAVVLILPYVARAQTGAAVPEIYTYFALPGDTTFTWGPITLDSQTVLSRDTNGRAHISVLAVQGPPGADGPIGPPGANGVAVCPKITQGDGLTLAVAPDGTCTIGTDPTVRLYAPLPAGTPTPVPGPCPGYQWVYYDSQYSYPCVPDPANPSGWIQARQAYETNWAPAATPTAPIAKLTGPQGVTIDASGFVTVTFGQIFQGVSVSNAVIVPLPSPEPTPVEEKAEK